LLTLRSRACKRQHDDVKVLSRLLGFSTFEC